MSALQTVQCYKCGVWFGLETGHHSYLKRDKTDFYCPNGHPQSYTENEADRLRRERDRLKQELAQRDDALLAARVASEKQEKKYRRLEKRTAAGTCPCCKRTFSNMARHMTTKHPEFVQDHTQKEIPEEDKVVPIRRGRRKAS